MVDCLNHSELDALLSDTLSEAEKACAEAHLARCESCRRKLEGLRPVDPQETVSTSPRTADTSGGNRGARSLPTNDVIEGYEILSEIHRGGQGIVYKVIQKSTKRTVALKVLPKGSFATPQQKHRFEREINLVARLQHPNIVTIYDSGLAQGQYYFAMEYVHGRPADVYVEETKPSIDETLRLFAKICAAVNYAHQQGVIHRDLKPGNILIDAEGEPHILDFGLAKAAGPGLLDGGVPVTVTSEFMGTLAYASPEQTKGDPSLVDIRTDVYSLGVVLYKMLTGAYPYDLSDKLAELLENITEAKPQKPSSLRRELGDEIDTIVLTALAKDKERRYQTAGELGRDVERFLQGQTIEARRDSLSYMLRIRGRAFVQRYRVLSLLGVILIAALLAQYVCVPLAFRWTPANRLFVHLVTVTLHSPSPRPSLFNVRVIGLTDDTDVEAIANQEGLMNVDANYVKSFRRLHGRLMEKLARAGIRVIAWDIAFRGQTEFDQDFVRGVRAMKDAGADVIVGVDSWWLDNRGVPDMSPSIVPEVGWGCVTARMDAEAPWAVEIVMQRGNIDPLPSLALSAVAAYRNPGAEVDLVLDTDSQSLGMLYWKPSPDMPRARAQVGEPDRIGSLRVWTEDKDDPASGVRPGDTISYYLLNIPQDNMLSESTIDYEEVFAASEEQLRAWLEGKVVVIGDVRSGVDRYKHPDGRTLSGCYGHAVAIEALLGALSPSFRQPWISLHWITFGGAVLGLMTGLIAPGRRAIRYVVLVVVMIVFLGASVWAAREYQYLCNPLIPSFALVVACGLATMVNRITNPWRT